LMTRWLASNTGTICYFAFMLNFFLKPTLLSFVVPATLLCYGLIENPRPSKSFWMWCLAFVEIKICATFVFQLPIFQCIHGQSAIYTLNPLLGGFNASNVDFGGTQLNTDYVLSTCEFWGLTKETAETKFWLLTLGDILCLLCLSFHRSALKSRGLWDLNEQEVILTKARIEEDLVSLSPSQRSQDSSTTWNYIPDFDNLKHDVWIHRILKWCSDPIRRYFYQIVPCNKDGSRNFYVKQGKEFYVYIFFVEIIALFYALIFWPAMVENSSSDVGNQVKEVFYTNIFSASMVVFAVVQIMFIVMDRVVYLFRSSWGKLLMQYVTVIFFHWFIFYYCPANSTSDKKFTDSPVLMIYYLLKIAYFFYSARQIRYGFPEFEASHHFITRKFSWTRSLFLRTFRALPFVYEFRMLLDWICIKTSLDLWETLKLEDIFSQLYYVKVTIQWRLFHKRGEPQPAYMKFLNGVLLFALLLVIVITPLLLFSSLNPASNLNKVESVQMSFYLQNLQFHLFDIRAVQSSETLSAKSVDEVVSASLVDPSKQTIQRLVLSPFPDSSISLFNLKLLYQTINQSTPVAYSAQKSGNETI
jgi:hypothetical protein